jgi:hypothetical protein
MINAWNVLFDWTPAFIARNFPSLKILEGPKIKIWRRNSAFTKAMAEDSGNCAAIVQERLARYAKSSARARRQPGIKGAISRHTRGERRSCGFVLRTLLTFSLRDSPNRRYVVSTPFKSRYAWLICRS